MTDQASEPQWWQSGVVYQIYPRSFADGNEDGIGDLAGIATHLDYLARLGVDVIWLSPIYRSPQDDAGYDISDYQDIDPLFGTLDEFDRLLDAVHERGMKLVMDLVVNHTSDEHPWFVESRSSRDNPKRDWYWWRPPRAGHAAGDPGAEPTNWESFFSGPVWALDEATGEYYLHLFSPKQVDLNWENPQVRQAVYAMMRWWLDRGVDGFRMDVINMISKDTALPDGPIIGAGPLGDGAASYMTGPRVHEFLHEMYTEVFAGRTGQLLTVGETPSVTVEQARLFTDPARQEVDMVFQFEHVDLDSGPGGKWDLRPFRLLDLKESFGRWQAGLGTVGWNSLYWDNHDQPRAVSRFGTDDPRFRVHAAKLLATILHLHRGTPYVYQGEELGMTNAPFATIADFRDIESLNHYAKALAAGADQEQLMAALRTKSRDNARTPVQWDPSPHAGFTTGTPWLAVNPNYLEINAAAQVDDPDSVFSHYRSLIDLRHREATVARGDFTMLLPDDPSVYAFTRRLDQVELLVLGNFSDDISAAVEALDDAWADSELVNANYPPPYPDLTLRPWEARVYRRRVDDRPANPVDAARDRSARPPSAAAGQRDGEATAHLSCAGMDALDTEALLQPVLEDLAVVVAAIEADQLTRVTPNTERDVATLRSHTIGWLDAFAAGFADPAGKTPLEHAGDFAVDDAGAQVRAAAKRLHAAIADGAGQRPLFIGANSMPGEMSLSMILWEYVVHGWDLARATGQGWSPDTAAVEAALAFAPGMLTPDFQGEGKAFGPPVEVSADAGALDRLLGLSGRDPSWTPTA